MVVAVHCVDRYSLIKTYRPFKTGPCPLFVQSMGGGGVMCIDKYLKTVRNIVRYHKQLVRPKY